MLSQARTDVCFRGFAVMFRVFLHPPRQSLSTGLRSCPVRKRRSGEARAAPRGVVGKGYHPGFPIPSRARASPRRPSPRARRASQMCRPGASARDLTDFRRWISHSYVTRLAASRNYSSSRSPPTHPRASRPHSSSRSPKTRPRNDFYPRLCLVLSISTVGAGAKRKKKRNSLCHADGGATTSARGATTLDMSTSTILNRVSGPDA